MRTRGGARWLTGVVVALVVLAGSAPSASAGEVTPGPIRKLGRGVANIATCPLELIRTPELTARKSGYWSALTIGIVHGAWRTVVRGVTGAFEVLTFFAEIPDGYGPLMKPEFVWSQGNWVE